MSIYRLTGSRELKVQFFFRITHVNNLNIGHYQDLRPWNNNFMVRSGKADPNNVSRGTADLSEMLVSQSNVDLNDRVTVNRLTSVSVLETS